MPAAFYRLDELLLLRKTSQQFYQARTTRNLIKWSKLRPLRLVLYMKPPLLNKLAHFQLQLRPWSDNFCIHENNFSPANVIEKVFLRGLVKAPRTTVQMTQCSLQIRSFTHFSCFEIEKPWPVSYKLFFFACDEKF